MLRRLSVALFMRRQLSLYTETISCERIDKRSPLVIIHGMLGAGINWKSIARILHRRPEWNRDVICVDLRNHGASPHATTMKLAEMSSDIIETLHGLKVTAATIMGHSLGGKVAMVTALTNPSFVDRLIVADILPVTYPRAEMSEMQVILAAMADLPLAQMKDRRDADKWLEPRVCHTSTRQFILTNLVERDGQYHWRLNLRIIRESFWDMNNFDLTQTAPLPTLLISGERATYVTAERLPAMYQRFPNTQHVPLKAGHWVHAEQPREFVDIVAKFCSGAE